ncbi:MAG: hypothetical protein J6T69_05060, partial [Methanobrevibacter sp.]|nr:hypothetical protein [Methanobrevibacter sp.]
MLVQSVIASIFVIVPLALTVIPYKGDYSLDLSDNKGGVNYFKEKEYVEKTIDDYAEEDHNPLFDKNGSFVSPYKSLRNRFKRNDNDDEESQKSKNSKKEITTVIYEELDEDSFSDESAKNTNIKSKNKIKNN